MSGYERAKARCKELDELHPQFRRIVGIRYGIVRVRKHLENSYEILD